MSLDPNVRRAISGRVFRNPVSGGGLSHRRRIMDFRKTASDDETEASKRFAQSASDYLTDAGSGGSCSRNLPVLNRREFRLAARFRGRFIRCESAFPSTTDSRAGILNRCPAIQCEIDALRPIRRVLSSKLGAKYPAPAPENY